MRMSDQSAHLVRWMPALKQVTVRYLVRCKGIHLHSREGNHVQLILALDQVIARTVEKLFRHCNSSKRINHAGEH